MPLSCSSVSMPRVLFIWFLSEEHEDLADLLDLLGLCPSTNGTQSLVALIAVKAGGAHLDELVRAERAVDLRDHFIGEAFGADVNNRIQLVGFRLERLAFGRGQHE